MSFLAPRPGEDHRHLAGPEDLGRFVLWAGTRGLYEVRENPDGDIAQILLGAWL